MELELAGHIWNILLIANHQHPFGATANGN
jgi:hypothetical protein